MKTMRRRLNLFKQCVGDLIFLHECDRQTDGQRDGWQTVHDALARPRICVT